jgi:hypothetical protein
MSFLKIFSQRKKPVLMSREGNLDKGLEKSKHLFFFRSHPAIAGTKVDDDVLDNLEEICCFRCWCENNLKIIPELKNVLPKINILVPKSLNEILQEIAVYYQKITGEATEFFVIPTKLSHV